MNTLEITENEKRRIIENEVRNYEKGHPVQLS